jgi:CubicO group peptidase (beta-lactamase class C family)
MADAALERAVQAALDVSVSSLFFAGSAAKRILSSLVHVLIAAGELDYELRLAEVWPKFAAHGEGDVTVRQVLMHQAGVPGLPLDLTTEELCDWEHMCGLLAANGSAAYADIDAGVAVALMRDLFSPDVTAIARLDEIVADAYPSPAHREHRRSR